MDEELIKNEILEGLLQVDSTFSITDFFATYDKETRALSVSFVAQNEKEEIKVVTDYA